MFRRRIFALALCFMLAFSSVAFAAEGDTVLFESGDSGYSEVSIDSAVAIGDTLYMCTWNDLYTYKLGDGEPVKFLKLSEDYTPSEEPEAAATPAPVESIEGVSEDASNQYFWRNRLSGSFAYQGKLHMIYLATGEIKVLEGDRFADTDMKIEAPSGTEDYDVSSYFTSIFEFEGKLYVLARVDMNDWEAPLELWVVDPATGKHEVIKTEFSLKGVCAYEPGKLLAWTRPEWGSLGTDYKEEDYYPLMFVIDAATGKTLEGPIVAAESAWSNLCGPVYDANSGMIFYTAQNKLIRRSSLNAEAEIVSYFTREMYQTFSSGSILSGTHLVFPTYEGVYIRNIEADAVAGKALKIANHYMTDASSAFMRENPDIPLDFVNVDGLYGASADEIAQLIGSGEDSIDIYIVSSSSNMRQLIEKGYAQDLSGSEAIMRALDRMYEPIREEISVDGKPMGFPVYVSPSLWSYNKEKFDELGLQYPETYSDLIDLFERWERELADENPSITLMNDYGQSENYLKLQMFYVAISQYMQEFGKPDQPIKFNTPEFLEVMRKIEAMPGELEYDSSSFSYEYDENLVLLLQMNFGFESYYSEGGASTPAYAPRLGADSEPGVGIYLNLFIINPNSANVDSAIKYVEYMTEHGEYSAMLAMYPDFNEPLKEEWAAEEFERAQKELADANAEEVTEKNQRDAENRIEEAERWVEYVSSRLWRVRRETIDEYRALVEGGRLYVDSGNSLFGSGSASKEVSDLIERYMKGQINLDQMVRELDQKMQMIFYEQQ